MDHVLNASTAADKLLSALTQPPADLRADDDDDNVARPQPAMLPADHPLLAKFQRALRDHLLKVNAALQTDIDGLDAGIAEMQREQEEVGAQLYDDQAEIERQRDALDEYNRQRHELSAKRLQHEASAARTQLLVVDQQRTFEELQRVHADHQMELQHLQALESNIGKWQQEIDDQVQLARRVVSKDGRDQVLAVQQKCQMDMMLCNLEGQVKRNERQLAVLQDQLDGQQRVVEVLNQSITDADADVLALQTEHKHLIGAWNDVIRCIKQRERILARLNEDTFNEKQKQKVTDSNIEGTKKSSTKEMEQNERLEAIRMKIVGDVENLEQQIEKETGKCDKLQRKINSMTKLIAETEASHGRATVEGHVVENQLKTLRRSIERQNEKKLKLEEQTLELLQEQISTDQASQHRGKMLRDVQQKRRSMELSMFSVEQQLSQSMLEMEQIKSTVENDKILVAKLSESKNEESKIAHAKSQELSATVQSIATKTKRFEEIYQKLHQLIEAAGGQECDPNELKAIALEKKISEIDAQIREVQAFWLQTQGHVVSLTERRSEQTTTIHLTRKQLVVIEQKSLKVEAELATLLKQGTETRRTITNMYIKLETLNAKLFAGKLDNQSAETECQVSHQHLVNRLRDEELAVLRSNDETAARRRDIEEARAAAVERHREALAWETKWKMAAETLRYRNNETAAASECGLMRSEIHRMEVRLGQLRRAQEKLAQDMEHCVQHRDRIYDGARLRSRLPDGGTRGSRYTVQHRLNDVRNRLKQAQTELGALERELTEVADGEQRYAEDVCMLQRMEDEERAQAAMLAEEIEQKRLQRQENLERIVRVQQRAKQYRGLLGDRVPKGASEAKVQADGDRQSEIQRHLVEVLESLLQQYPFQVWPIRRALQTLNVE